VFCPVYEVLWVRLENRCRRKPTEGLKLFPVDSQRLLLRNREYASPEWDNKCGTYSRMAERIGTRMVGSRQSALVGM